MKMSNAERLGTKEHRSSISLCTCGVGHRVGTKFITNNPANKDVILTWFLQGKGRYIEGGKEYPLTDYCVCLRNTGCPFTLEIMDDTCPRLFFAIPFELYQLLNILIPELKEMPPIWEHRFSQDTFDAFFDIYDQLKRTASAEFYRLIPQVVHYILLITGIQQRRDRFPLEKGKRYLEDNQSLTLEEIAEKCGMSYPNFRRQFAKIYGISPGQYRIQKRIDRAIRWLKCGISVTETAELLGYPDVYTFSHQFNAVVGFPPSKFKEENENPDVSLFY